MANTISDGSAAAASTGLCTLAQAKAALGITAADKDTSVQSLVDAATAWIQRECDRTFAATSYTEYFSPGRDERVLGDGTILQPRHYPIISVTSLHQSALRTFDAAALIAEADYFVEDGNATIALYVDGDTVALDYGQRTVKLIYTAGYATIPADLARACVMLTAHLYYSADRQKQNIASESLGGVTVSYKSEKMPKEVEAIIAKYRRQAGQ